MLVIPAVCRRQTVGAGDPRGLAPSERPPFLTLTTTTSVNNGHVDASDPAFMSSPRHHITACRVSVARDLWHDGNSVDSEARDIVTSNKRVTVTGGALVSSVATTRPTLTALTLPSGSGEGKRQAKRQQLRRKDGAELWSDVYEIPTVRVQCDLLRKYHRYLFYMLENTATAGATPSNCVQSVIYFRFITLSHMTSSCYASDMSSIAVSSDSDGVGTRSFPALREHDYVCEQPI